MRIAMFTEVFLPKIDGVVTRVIRTLDELADMGHQVRVFAPYDPPPVYAGHKVTRVRSVPFRPVYPEIRVGLPTPNIAQKMVDFSPDVVHAVNPAALAAFGVLSAQRRDVPLLASYHTQLSQYVEKMRLSWLRPTADWWTKYLHNKASVNLCTSPQMVDAATTIGVQNVHLWPKAVDTKTYHPGAASDQMRHRLTDGHPDDPLAIYVGRLSVEKNLEALLPVVHAMPHVRFAMVGSGPARSKLKAMFSGTNTVFTGYMSGTELAAAYASADVFLFPSTTETLGFVGLESMASGVPVIGANAGGIPDIIDHDVTGFLVEPHDTQAYVERVTQLIDDPNLREKMGAAARAEAETHSWRQSTEALVDYYRMAIELHNTEQN